MKKVFNNRDCIYAWLEQTQQQGRNKSGWIHFEGEFLSITPNSWQTQFARIINRKYVLIDIWRLIDYRGRARKSDVLCAISRSYHKIFFVQKLNEECVAKLFNERKTRAEEIRSKAQSKHGTDRHLLEYERMEKEKLEFIQLVGAHVLMKERMTA